MDTPEIVEIDLIEICRILMASKESRHHFLAEYIVWLIGVQVYSLRVQRNWSQKELARRARINATTVIRLEKGEAGSATSINTLLKIAHAFDCGLLIKFRSFSSMMAEISEMQTDARKGSLGQFLSADTFENLLERTALDKWAGKN